MNVFLCFMCIDSSSYDYMCLALSLSFRKFDSRSRL